MKLDLDALRYVLRRMWSLTFVLGSGLYLIACFLHGDARDILALPMAFNGGVFVCMWMNNFQRDRLVSACHALAQVCAEQRKMLDDMTTAVEGIVGKPKE